MLGTKYSQMKATFLDAQGQEQLAVMGCLWHRRKPRGRRIG